MKNYEPLTDLQWQLLEPLFPNPIKASRGKPHSPWRMVVNSILVVLVKGIKWGALPKDPAYATKSAAHRWFLIWDKSGFLSELLAAYQNMVSIGAEIRLPSRRKRLPSARATPDPIA